MSKDARNTNGLCIMTAGITLCISLFVTCNEVTAQTHVFGNSAYKESRVYRGYQRAECQAKVGTPAPEFSSLTWVNSPPITLASLKGKMVLLHFWRGECDCCHEALNTVRLLQTNYASKGLVVIGIRMGKKSDSLVKEWDVSFPVAVDSRGTTVKKYWFDNTSNWIPGTYLIGRNGNVEWACQQQRLWRPMKEPCTDFTTVSLIIRERLKSTKASQSETTSKRIETVHWAVPERPCKSLN